MSSTYVPCVINPYGTLTSGYDMSSTTHQHLLIAHGRVQHTNTHAWACSHMVQYNTPTLSRGTWSSTTSQHSRMPHVPAWNFLDNAINTQLWHVVQPGISWTTLSTLSRGTWSSIISQNPLMPRVLAWNFLNNYQHSFWHVDQYNASNSLLPHRLDNTSTLSHAIGPVSCSEQHIFTHITYARMFRTTHQ
jgi:hypothetical protein